MKRLLFLIVFLTSCLSDNPTHIPTEEEYEAEYMRETLKYYKDTKTNLCFAVTNRNTLASVPCTSEIEKIAIKF